MTSQTAVHHKVVHVPQTAPDKRPRIFVLDDDPEMGRLVEKVLVRQNYLVSTSHCPQEALEELLTGRYDLLITDLRMPGMDGLALMRIVLDAVPRMRVVLMSAYGSMEDYRQAIQAGAYGYLPKPLSMSDLRRVAEKALGSDG